MRIIITKNGKFLVKEFMDTNNLSEKDDKKRYLSAVKFPNISKNKEMETSTFYRTHEKGSKNYKTKSLISKNIIDNYFNRDETRVSIKELQRAKKIKLSKVKLNITQQYLDRYDDFDSTYKEKMDKLSNVLSSKEPKKENEQTETKSRNEQSEFNGQNIEMTRDTGLGYNRTSSVKGKNKRVLLGQIISRNNLQCLKKQISKYNIGYNDIRLPLGDNNKDSFNFRTKSEDKKASIDDLKFILSLPINADRTNLIKYFQQNKYISPHYFEYLLKCDEAQIYRLNKICQMIMVKNEEEFKEQKINQDKKDNKEKLIKQRSNNSMASINKIINRSNNIIIGYNNYKRNIRIKKQKIFREDVKKIKQEYWDKYGVDKFLKKNKKVESCPKFLNSIDNSTISINDKNGEKKYLIQSSVKQMPSI